jgi:transposase-like protein
MGSMNGWCSTNIVLRKQPWYHAGPDPSIARKPRLREVTAVAMAFRQLHCPCCQNLDVIKHGMTAQGKQRYRCKNRRCTGLTFLVEYSHHGRRPEVKQHMLEMTMHGRGIRDMARVLPISPRTVIDALNKRTSTPARQFRSTSTHRSRRGDR